MSADESVKILIEAEDQASKKMLAVQKQTEALANNVKTLGGRTKATAEFTGTLASLMGGSEFGQYAGQIAAITEKTSQFGEVAKAGGAGALAFKAGLVGLVGYASFQVGKVFADLIWNTKEYERELAKLHETSQRTFKEVAAANERFFSNQHEDIELISNPEEKRAAYEALFAQTNKDVSTMTQRLAESTKAAEEWEDAWKITGDRKIYAEEAKRQMESDKERLEMLKQERTRLRDILGDRTAINEQTKISNELAAKSESFLAGLREEVSLLKMSAEERKKAEAINNTNNEGAASEAFRLFEERDALIEKQKIEEDAAKTAIDRERELAKLRADSLDALRQERIAILEGAEAAEIFALQKQGLDEATAKLIASERAAVDVLRNEKEERERVDALIQSEKQRAEVEITRALQGDQAAASLQYQQQGLTKDEADKLAMQQEFLKGLQSAEKATPQLTAVESRLQTRGRTDDPTQKVAVNTAEAVKQLQRLNDNIRNKQNVTPKIELEVVGN